MHVAVAQLNLMVGALQDNATRMLESWRAGVRAGAKVVVTPELSLAGYAPEDLVLRRAFLSDCAQTLRHMAAAVDEGALLVGFPEYDGGQRYNAIALLRKKKVQAVYRKRVLNAEDTRYFAQGKAPLSFTEGGTRFGVALGDDLSATAIKRALAAENNHCLLTADRRAYQMGDETGVESDFARAAKSMKTPMIVTEPFGGQDAKVFMGRSFAVNEKGVLVHHLPAWQEALALIQVKKGGITESTVFEPMPAEYHVYQALVTALADYVKKNKMSGVVLGLSGGIDSALCCAIAVDALGAEKVHTVQLYSPHTSALSRKLAAKMAKWMGVSQVSIALAPLMRGTESALKGAIGTELSDITTQNIQARLRALLLMGLSNQYNRLLISTGNKSESAAGYATLYGDMAGGFSLIKDLTKAWVYRLANYRNQLSRVIPEEVITRAPTAELKPGQTDQDTLPPYPILDQIIETYVEDGADAASLSEYNISADHIESVLSKLAAAEYKRRQAAPGVCITRRAFGEDWHYPMTCRWQEFVR
ncbi:MAG: NAD+ synthase [Burkholderiales bacterium]|nr:NAD+ synthase [Burkholderiales bacterium]